MLLIVIAAALGLLAGGFPGLVIGAALGYWISRSLRHTVLGGLQVVQSQLLDSTFSELTGEIRRCARERPPERCSRSNIASTTLI